MYQFLNCASQYCGLAMFKPYFFTCIRKSVETSVCNSIFAYKVCVPYIVYIKNSLFLLCLESLLYLCEQSRVYIINISI